MEQNTLYTAIGRLDRETNGCGRSCPVIRLGGQTYMVDMQEMVVWTALNWRISKREDISLQCDKLVSSLGDCISRSWDACVNRLLTRGLLVSGCGETEYDALYDLLSSLGIIPASGSMLMRSISFVKLVAGRRVPIQQALKLFQKDRRTDYETRVMRLAQQALLSTAEIIKCVEQDVAYLPNEQFLMEAVYGDDETTCYNIAGIMKNSRSSQAVTLAVANLYLRQQIILRGLPHEESMEPIPVRATAKDFVDLFGRARKHCPQPNHLHYYHRPYPAGTGQHNLSCLSGTG